MLNERVLLEKNRNILWMNIKEEENPWGNFPPVHTFFLLSLLLLLLCMLMYEIVYNVKEEIDGLMGIFYLQIACIV